MKWIKNSTRDCLRGLKGGKRYDWSMVVPSFHVVVQLRHSHYIVLQRFPLESKGFHCQQRLQMHVPPSLVMWLFLVCSTFLPRLRLSMCTEGHTWKCCMHEAAYPFHANSIIPWSNLLEDVMVPTGLIASTQDYYLVVIGKLSVTRKTFWKVCAWQ